MASCLQSLCLMVLATLYVVCQGQCIVRALMPSMTVMECPSSGQCCVPCDDSSSSTTEDLSALLALARALEQDKAHNANSGIDVNALLDTLIHAMVCIAKPESSTGGYASGFPNSPIARHGTSPSAGQAAKTPPAAGSAGTENLGVGGVVDTVVDTVGGLLDGSGAGGVPKLLNTVTGTVGNLLGGGSGSGGLVDSVGSTVGGLTGGGGAGAGGLLGGLTGGGSSGGSGLGGVVGGLTGGSGSKGGLL